MKTIFLLSIFLCFTSFYVAAQNKDTLQQPGYFSFTYDNDFFNATDRYYTQGIRLELALPFVKKSPVSRLLIPLQKGGFGQYAVALEQDCFTPPGISRDTIQTRERPYAGLLYLSHSLNSIQPQKHQKLFTQLTIGVIGPCAKCKEMQEGIHRWLDNIAPRGWKFQVANDVVLNYDAQFEKGIWWKKRLELVGYAAARAGTLYDDAAIGSLLRFGFFKPYFSNQIEGKQSKFQVHGFINGNVKLVAYNATLQGGLFNPNDIYILPANRIKRVVAAGSVGIIFSYNKVNLEFTRLFLSPDFKGGLSHGWGHINIRVDF